MPKRWSNYDTELDIFWLLYGGTLIFTMQIGYAMLEFGSTHLNNKNSVVVKNIFSLSITAICWWVIGWSLAFGNDRNGILGVSEYFSGSLPNYSYWFFQWSLATNATSIVSGALAERLKLEAYLVYIIVMSIIIYPLIVHWAWSDGWASPYRSNYKEILLQGCGVIDFAGSGIVHMTGGTSALIAVRMLKQRVQRTIHTESPLETYGPIFRSLGTLFLWLGSYGLHAVATVSFSANSEVAARVVVTTTLSASMSCLVSMLMGRLHEGYLSLSLANFGAISGLFSISAACATCSPEGSLVIGFVSGVLYYYSSRLLHQMNLDDAIDAIPLHFVSGVWGLIAAGLFTSKEGYFSAYYHYYRDGESRVDHCAGIFYGGSGHQLLANVIFLLAILAWCGTISIITFFFIDIFVKLHHHEPLLLTGAGAAAASTYYDSIRILKTIRGEL